MKALAFKIFLFPLFSDCFRKLVLQSVVHSYPNRIDGTEIVFFCSGTRSHLHNARNILLKPIIGKLMDFFFFIIGRQMSSLTRILSIKNYKMQLKQALIHIYYYFTTPIEISYLHKFHFSTRLSRPFNHSHHLYQKPLR